MDISDVNKHARALYAAHGDRAEAEAAQKAQAAVAAGNGDDAENWQRIRNAIRSLRGALAS